MPDSGIRNHIRSLRFQRDRMTQQELADRVRCTRQTIIALEQGKYLPTLTLAFRIAREFGVPVEEVFELAEEGGSGGSP